MISTLRRTSSAITLAILLGLLPFSSYPQTFANRKDYKSSQHVSSNMMLRDALLQLKGRYRVNILFEEKLLEGIVVNDSVLNTATGIEQNLHAILSPHGLKFQKVKKNSYVIVSSPGLGVATEQGLPSEVPGVDLAQRPEVTVENVTEKYYAQTVQGVVRDENGQGMPGVNVLEKNTSNGTTTDFNGAFTLNVESESSVLVISFIGYVSQEITVGTRSQVEVSLQPDVTSLSEVVVIGYGSREKKDLTGSLTSMQSDDIVKTVPVTPELAMQGRMAGVFVSSPGGSPLARPTVLIRGRSTFNSANPLYVIDGVPLFEFGGGEKATGETEFLRGGVNPLTLISPNDIESMTVLKDASASAIYGSRAANGVVLITTKRGKSGRPKVEVSTSFGVQNVPKKYDMLNTEEYTALYQEMLNNRWEYDRVHAPNADPDVPHPWDVNKVTVSGVDYFPLKVYDPNGADGYFTYLGNSSTYNWQDELLNKNAAMQDYSVRVSGGSDATTYYIGTNYNRTESPLVTSDLERYSMTTNIDSKISKVIEAGALYRLSYVEAYDNQYFGGDLEGASHVAPWQPIYDPNDPTGFARTSDVSFVPNPDFDLSKASPGPKFNILQNSQNLRPWGIESNSNYFAQQALRDNSYSLVKNFGTAYLQVQPLKGFKIKGSISFDYTTNMRKEWSNFEEVRFSETPGNPYDNQDGTAKGYYTERQVRNLTLLKDITLNYNRSFGSHNFDLLVNASDQQMDWKILSGGSPIAYTEKQFRVVGADNRWTNTGSGFDKKVILGYVARLSYNYDGKYYLDLSYRRDASTEYAPGYRWGNFPGVAAAWRISSEKFFQSAVPFIEDLKFRVGYGSLGNTFSLDMGRTPFAYLSTVSTTPDYPLGSGNGDSYGANRVGAYLPGFPNYSLTWEKATTFNVGADFTLLSGRLSGTLEYYNKLTDGIIQAVDLPLNSGINQRVQYNVATVRNAGVELELSYNANIGPVNVSLGGNITTVRNRVESLYNNVNNYGGGLAVGYPIGFLWGQQVGGVFQTQEEIDAYRAIYTDGAGANQRPGDMWFRDVHGNPRQDVEESFSPIPDSLVNDNDRTFIGKTIPGFYYGFNISAAYRGFDLAVFFQGIGDVQKYNSARNSGELLSGNGLNMWTTVRDRWTPENPSSTMPRAIYGDPNQNARYSDRFVEDAGFLRLKNVQLGYTVPKGFLSQSGFIESFRVYVSGTNLFTATKWKGIDPENDFTPPTRVLSLGINATF